MGHSILLILGMGILASAANNEEDYYTSIVSLQELARREQEIVKAVTNYRKLLTERLDLIDGLSY